MKLQDEKIVTLAEVIEKVLPLAKDDTTLTSDMLKEMKRYIESILLTDF
jgi:hypothetical protein